jgi:hypothetical protein
MLSVLIVILQGLRNRFSRRLRVVRLGLGTREDGYPFGSMCNAYLYAPGPGMNDFS